MRGVDATLSAYERDRDRAGFLLAGALAYRLFLWLLPFTLVIVAGLGFLEASDHDNPADLADKLGVVGLASKSVSEAAADAEHARFIVLLIGISALYLASLGAIKAFRAVSALAWGVPAGPLGRKPLAVLGLLGLIAAFFTVTFVGTAIRHESPGPGLIATLLIGIAYVWLAFLVLWILPRPSVHWTAILPGAITIGLGPAGDPSRQRVFHLVPHFEILRDVRCPRCRGGAPALALPHRSPVRGRRDTQRDALGARRARTQQEASRGPITQSG